MEELDDETLAELVRGYPVLYDKTHNEFHRKDVKENAWANVAEELGVGKSEAERAFDKLRDRFVRARRELAKEDQPGTLEWLHSHTPRRQSKTNMSVIDVDEESDHNKENGVETDFTREKDADIGDSTDALFHTPTPQKTPPAESNNNKSFKKCCENCY